MKLALGALVLVLAAGCGGTSSPSADDTPTSGDAPSSSAPADTTKALCELMLTTTKQANGSTAAQNAEALRLSADSSAAARSALAGINAANKANDLGKAAQAWGHMQSACSSVGVTLPDLF